MLSQHVDSDGGTGRRAHWSTTLRDFCGPHRPHQHPSRSIHSESSAHAIQIGNLTLSRATRCHADVRNTPQLTRRTAGRSYHLLIVESPQRLIMGGQVLELQPGDFTLADSTLHSAIVIEQPHTTLDLSIPASFLRAYVPNPDRAVGLRFPGSEGPSQVVSLMLREMWRLAESGTLMSVASRLLASLFEAFSACCDLMEPQRNASTSSASARRAQILEAIHARLRDPELSLRSLARDLGLSTRYVQMLFNEDGGDSIARYIRNQRLEGCRRELADPAWREHSVTGIAFRWGFNSAAHFCRVFHAQYGMSPSRFREQALAHAGCEDRVRQKTHSGLMGAAVAPGMRSGAVVSR